MRLRTIVRIAAWLILAAITPADAQQGDPLCEANRSCPYHRFCSLARADYPPGTHVQIRCEWPLASVGRIDDYVLIDCPGFGPPVLSHWRPYDQDCQHPFTNRRRW